MMAQEYLMAAAGALENGDMPTALNEVRRAVSEPTEWPLRGHILHGAGFINRRAGNIDVACQYFKEFVEGAGEDGNGVPMTKVHDGWYIYGLCLRQLSREADAVVAYKNAVAGFRSSGNTQYLGYALTNLAFAASLRNLTDVAKGALEEAETIVSSDSDLHHLKLSKALYSHVTGDNEKANHLATTLLNDETASPDVQCHAAWVKAHVYLYRGDKANAVSMANLASSVAERTSDPVRFTKDVSGLFDTIKNAS